MLYFYALLAIIFIGAVVSASCSVVNFFDRFADRVDEISDNLEQIKKALDNDDKK